MGLKVMFLTCLVLGLLLFIPSISGKGFSSSREGGIGTDALKGFEKFVTLLIHDDIDPAYEPLRKEIVNEVLASLEVCQSGIDVASYKVNSILEHLPSDEHINEGSEDADSSEENFMEPLEYEIKVLVDDFSDTFKIEEIEKLALLKKNYINDFEKVLQTMRNACSSLPSALPIIHNRKIRNAQKVAQRLAHSLKKWTEKWLMSIENNIDAFFITCMDNEECKQYLEKIIKTLVQVLKEYKFHIGEDTFAILEELQRLPYKSSPSLETLNHLQKAVLHVGNTFDPFHEEENSFHIASAVNGLDTDYSIITEGKSLGNHVDLLSSLIHQRSKGTKNIQAALVEIELNNLIDKLPSTFLSVAFGSSIIQHGWGEVKLQQTKFKKIISALSPSILRVGGSAANFLTYDPSNNEEEENQKINPSPKIRLHKRSHPKFKRYHQEDKTNYLIKNLIPTSVVHPKSGKRNQYAIETNRIDSLHLLDEISSEDLCEPQFEFQKDYKNFTMTKSDWKFLTDFVKELHWELLFDLNQFWRDSQGNWDPTNARLIINDPSSAQVPIIWQLGNEPNSYHHKFNWSITPEQDAQDYKILSKEINRNDHSMSAFMVGPDVTRPKNNFSEVALEEDSVKFLKTFLKEQNSIDAVTFHQYYVNGKTATIDDFLSSDTLNAFPRELYKIVSIRDKLVKGKPIWITETSTAWGGGAPGLSDRFVSSFPWLDKLGAAALGGASHVFRQTLYGGCYALLDSQLNPNPDFWVSVLHKSLVGEGVLLPRTRLVPNSLRIYAHCLNSKHHMFQRGAIVLFGMNLSGKEELLKLMGKTLIDSAKFLYTVSAPQGNLVSKDVLLNGDLLKLSAEGDLPAFKAVEVKTELLTMAPWTLNFWVLPDADAKAC